MEEAKVLELVRNLVAEGRFGGAGEFVSLETENGAAMGAQFASELSFLELKVRRPSGETDLLPVVIKVQFSTAEVATHDLVACFNNEVVMYKDILPALNVKSTKRYPKVYYCYSNGDNDFSRDIIIMENMKTDGFSISKHKVFLDFDHISTALKALGEFHAWSYEHKGLNEDKFLNLQRKLMVHKMSENIFETTIFECVKKGIEPFLEKGIETNVLETFLKCFKKINKASQFLCKPDDVFGVIIHGDFNNNNIFYKYDEQGKPVDVALFDFQFAKYSSPAVDLSFFLYMNTEKSLRDEHWDDFLRIYWDAVEEHTPKEVSLPKYEEFLEHFASRAVFGYIPSSFFIAMMLDGTPPPKEGCTDDEFFNFHISLVNKYLQYNMDVVSHLLEHRYIHSFIDLWNRHHSS